MLRRNQLSEDDNGRSGYEAKTYRKKASTRATLEERSCAACELRKCNQAHSVQSEKRSQLTLMLQADIGRVNARAGEERRIVPQRDEKTLICVTE